MVDTDRPGSAGAADRVEAADENGGDAADDEPDAIVGWHAGDGFLGGGSDGIIGLDAKDQQDDTGDEDGEGEGSIHGRRLSGERSQPATRRPGETRRISLDRPS